MNGRRTGGSRLWPSGSNEIRWCNAGCPSLPCLSWADPPACRPCPDAQPDAVWADSTSGTWHSPMAIFPASHQRIRWLSAGGWERKNWRVFGGPPMYAIWVGTQWWVIACLSPIQHIQEWLQARKKKDQVTWKIGQIWNVDIQGNRLLVHTCSWLVHVANAGICIHTVYV